MSEQQSRPQDGDFVVHCAHISERSTSWYKCEDTQFQFGERSGPVHWMCVCISCELLLTEDQKSLNLQGLGVFQSQPKPMLVAPKFEDAPTIN